MARLCAVADGNNTSASTWALIDSTSWNESESNNLTVPTSYSTSYTQFTPGAITIDGIGTRISTRSGTTGTFSIELYNHTAAGSVAGTQVTVNCSDVVDAISGNNDKDAGWMFFKFGSPVTLIAANAYSLRFKTSTAAQIIAHAATSTNPSRMLRTTTTQAPTTGDDRFVMGEWTAAGTMTTRTVTLDDTSVVDYGSASTSTVTPALSISNGGIVQAGTSASTTYVQKISGTVVVYNGGVLKIATSGSRMPTSSSFTWTFDCVSNVDFGINIRRKGDFSAYGESKQRWTTLTSDEAASSTSIQVVSTSGWKNGDSLLFPTTSTTASQSEIKTISTVDSSTQVTLSAGLTNAHTGTGDVVGEVGNLTCNVTFIGTSSSVGTYMVFKDSAIVVLDNACVTYYGSSTTDKRGVESQNIVTTATNGVTLTSCVFREPMNNSSGCVGAINSNANLITIENCLLYFTTNTQGFVISGGGTSASYTFSYANNLSVGNSTSGNAYTIFGYTTTGGTIDNLRAAGGSQGFAFTIGHTYGYETTLSNLKAVGCSSGWNTAGGGAAVVNTGYFICCSNGQASGIGYKVFNNCNFIGNTNAGLTITSASTVSATHIYNNCTFRGRTSFAQPRGVYITGSHFATFNNCSFGQTIAHTSSDIALQGTYFDKAIFNNCILASTTEITANADQFTSDTGYIAIQRKDQTAGANTIYAKGVIITSDSTLYKTASPSIRMTPKSSVFTGSNKLFPFWVVVPSGMTCTPSVYVRESESGDGAAYNGNRAKLYLKANYNCGITSETLIDTATSSSDGAWEQLTGTTSAVTDDAVLEFYIVVDGTTGWLNVDDFSATVA